MGIRDFNGTSYGRGVRRRRIVPGRTEGADKSPRPPALCGPPSGGLSAPASCLEQPTVQYRAPSGSYSEKYTTDTAFNY